MSLFDKHFEREFKQTLAGLKQSTSTQFNISNLGLTPNLGASEISYLAKVQGILEQSVFSELNEKTHWVSNKTELSEGGLYSFSNKAKNLRVSKDEVLVGSQTLVKVPNNYHNPDPRVRYLGVEHSKSLGEPVMYFAVSKELVYPLPTFVVTVSTKTVPKHYGGRSVTLTNGHKVQIVIQNKKLTRNTDAKSIFYLTPSLETAGGVVESIHELLISNGRAFHPSFFSMVDGATGLSYNLVTRNIEATDDLPDELIEYSIKQREELKV